MNVYTHKLIDFIEGKVDGDMALRRKFNRVAREIHQYL